MKLCRAGCGCRVWAIELGARSLTIGRHDFSDADAWIAARQKTALGISTPEARPNQSRRLTVAIGASVLEFFGL